MKSLNSWVQARGRRRISSLDGVRGLAIVLVLLRHGLPDNAVPGAGIVGVDIFFVLSGFVITGNLLASASGPSKLRLGQFYVRRAFRLLPALYVMLALYVGASLVLRQDTRAAVGAAVASISYLYNFGAALGIPLGNGPLWTLSTEEQFYFIWPLLILVVFAFARRRPPAELARLACILMVLVWIVRAWSWFQWGTSIYTLPTSWADSLLAGSAMAAVRAASPNIWVNFGRKAGTTFAQAVAWLVVLGSIFIPNMKDQAWVYIFWLPVLGVAIAVALWGLIESPRRVPRKILESPVALFLGAVSYSVYLYNYLVFRSIGDHVHNALFLAVIGCFVSILLGTLSRRFVELPALSALHRRQVAQSPQGRSATQPTP